MDLILFFSLLIPITASPGPVNIALAGFGSRLGVLQTLPFFVGLSGSAALVTFICAVGMHELILQSELIFAIIQYAGIAYIFYLSAKFFKAKGGTAGEQKHKATFFDGFLLTLLNPKFYAMVVVVFGQFAAEGDDLLAVSLLFLATLLASQFLWLIFGVSIKSLIGKNARREYMVSVIFGMMLFLTAAFLLWNSLSVGN